jgi:hypothetical protein
MCCSDDADRNGRRLLLLGNGRISESKAQESSEKRVSHFGLWCHTKQLGDFHPIRRCHDSWIPTAPNFLAKGSRNL